MTRDEMLKRAIVAIERAEVVLEADGSALRAQAFAGVAQAYILLAREVRDRLPTEVEREAEQMVAAMEEANRIERVTSR